MQEAVISGFALGAGLELALCADIRVMEETARVGATGVNLGLVFSTQRLPRSIGLSRAGEILMTGRHINAKEAERIGLVHHISPDGYGLQEALKIK
ncbi:MAG TPA: enoyl-CoA hydratase/isomerase family protein [Syntrophothermus lipocalidus]|nr:enoyl-CoA hydratase/isomerase family protein [Syntrophothermus lipocalidus]